MHLTPSNAVGLSRKLRVGALKWCVGAGSGNHRVSDAGGAGLQGVVQPTSHLNPPLYTLNPQPSTLNTQHSTLNPQPYTLHPQPSRQNGVRAGSGNHRVSDAGGAGLQGVVQTTNEAAQRPRPLSSPGDIFLIGDSFLVERNYGIGTEKERNRNRIPIEQDQKSL